MENNLGWTETDVLKHHLMASSLFLCNEEKGSGEDRTMAQPNGNLPIYCQLETTRSNSFQGRKVRGPIVRFLEFICHVKLWEEVSRACKMLR